MVSEWFLKYEPENKGQDLPSVLELVLYENWSAGSS
jgi:hypothetical protein